MALTTIDFTKGIDLSVANPINAVDLNNLVDLAEPKSDTNGDGKGLILYTNDSALNTPVVPRADLTPKLKRYFWVRVPHVDAVNQEPITYAWNDHATSSATYYKWLISSPANTDILDRLDLLESHEALTLDKSSNALDTANAASVTANAASGVATTASGVASASKVTADASKITADEAKVLATNANTTVASALTTAGAKKAVDVALSVGAKQQRIRTSEDITKVEWYYEVDNYIQVAYIGGAQAIADTTWTKVSLNTLVNNSGALATLASSSITLKPGTYKCDAIAYTNSLGVCVLLLGNDTAKTKLLTGIAKNANSESPIVLNGVFAITVETVVSLYIYAKSAGNLALDNAAANINSNTGLPVGYAIPAVSEQLVTLELTKIG